MKCVIRICWTVRYLFTEQYQFYYRLNNLVGSISMTQRYYGIRISPSHFTSFLLFLPLSFAWSPFLLPFPFRLFWFRYISETFIWNLILLKSKEPKVLVSNVIVCIYNWQYCYNRFICANNILQGVSINCSLSYRK